MLSKQSIRKEHSIYLNGELLEKEEMLEISEEFSEVEVYENFEYMVRDGRGSMPKISEKEELRFRKMLKQGGKLTIQGNEFVIARKEYKVRNSRGEYEDAAKPHRKEDWE
jgi:hypothetical protein